MSIILATCEAEIERITVPGQPEQNSCQTPSQLIAGSAGTGHPKLLGV
jgi:hypothetical protein